MLEQILVRVGTAAGNRFLNLRNNYLSYINGTHAGLTCQEDKL